jgi:hypothetical protein
LYGPKKLLSRNLDETAPLEMNHDRRSPAARGYGGIIGGVFVLAFGFIVTLLVAAFSIFIILPLMLLGRILGLQVKTFRR